MSYFFCFIFAVFLSLKISTISSELICYSFYVKNSTTFNNFIISSLPSSNFDLLVIRLIQLSHFSHIGSFILPGHT